MRHASQRAAGRPTPAQTHLFNRQATAPADSANAKACSRCQNVKPLADFATQRKSPDGLQSWCRECSAEDQRVRRSTERGRRKHAEQARRARNRPTNAPKVAARRAVQAALRAGVLERPESCARCGSPGGRIHLHHHRGYEPEHWLDVVPICVRCDAQLQRPFRTISLARRYWAEPMFPDLEAAYWADLELPVPGC